MSDFPDNPFIGQEWPVGDQVFRWDGAKWTLARPVNARLGPLAVESREAQTDISTTPVILPGTTRGLPVVAGVTYLVDMWMPFRYGVGEAAFVYVELYANGVQIAQGGVYSTWMNNERGIVTNSILWTAPTNGATFDLRAYMTSGSNNFQVWPAQSNGRSYGYSLTPISDPVFAQPAVVPTAGIGALDQVVTITSSDAFVKANYPGLRSIRVRMVGGGGAGGGSDATTGTEGSAGGGGGGGAYAEFIVPASALSESEAVTIGSGGVGAAASTGGNGSDTVAFGVTCGAGNGAPRSTNANMDYFNSRGGTSGSVTGTPVGSVPFILSVDGTWGYPPAAAIYRSMGGHGADTLLGRGGHGGNAHTTTGQGGGGGRGYGSGGGGAAARPNSTSGFAGGDGAPGVVIIEVYV